MWFSLWLNNSQEPTFRETGRLRGGKEEMDSILFTLLLTTMQGIWLHSTTCQTDMSKKQYSLIWTGLGPDETAWLQVRAALKRLFCIQGSKTLAVTGDVPALQDCWNERIGPTTDYIHLYVRSPLCHVKANIFQILALSFANPRKHKLRPQLSVERWKGSMRVTSKAPRKGQDLSPAP